MILTKVEKELFIKHFSWMINDMVLRHNESYSAGNYSEVLTGALDLLESIKAIETTENIDYHRKSSLLNCREFACVSNKKGKCTAAKITLQSTNAAIIGNLMCVEAEKTKSKE